MAASNQTLQLLEQKTFIKGSFVKAPHPSCKNIEEVRTEEDDSYLDDLDDTAEREGESDEDDEERYEGQQVGADPGALLAHRL